MSSLEGGVGGGDGGGAWRNRKVKRKIYCAHKLYLSTLDDIFYPSLFTINMKRETLVLAQKFTFTQSCFAFMPLL